MPVTTSKRGRVSFGRGASACVTRFRVATHRVILLFGWALVGIGLGVFQSASPPTARAQNGSEENLRSCRQWMVTVFSANFPAYVPLDDVPWPEDSLRDASVSLPPDWEPLLVQGGFSALVPARRCLEWQ